MSLWRHKKTIIMVIIANKTVHFRLENESGLSWWSGPYRIVLDYTLKDQGNIYALAEPPVKTK